MFWSIEVQSDSHCVENLNEYGNYTNGTFIRLIIYLQIYKLVCGIYLNELMYVQKSKEEENRSWSRRIYFFITQHSRVWAEFLAPYSKGPL